MDHPASEEEARLAERVRDAGRYFQPPFLFHIEGGERQAIRVRVSVRVSFPHQVGRETGAAPKPLNHHAYSSPRLAPSFSPPHGRRFYSECRPWRSHTTSCTS